METKPTYLGDGLYAEEDGSEIRLFTNYGVGTAMEVFLDHPTLDAFFRFVERSSMKVEQTTDTKVEESP